MLQIDSPLVSVDWLNKRIDTEDLIVLDATIPKVSSTYSDNTLGYIPTSQFFDIKAKFSDTAAQFPNTIPTKLQFETGVRHLGVNNHSAVVVYDQHGMYSSSRAWWLFKYFGHTNIAVLNGGLPEWKAKGYRIIDTYVNNNKVGDFKGEVNQQLFTDFKGLNALFTDSETLIFDARPATRFTGKTPEPRKGLRSGTIPNSINLPYTRVLNGNKLKTKAELLVIFDKLVNSKKKLVFSCGSGITACNLALAASFLGYKDLVVYDGSWTEYGTLTEDIMNTPNWTKDELMAYILLYASHSDLKEDNHERNVIISKVDMNTFQKIHDEFSDDNDFQSIQKIIASIDKHNYTKANVNQILADIKALFFADGDFDVKEHSMLLFLRRILK